jgi:hypothetical protein
VRRLRSAPGDGALSDGGLITVAVPCRADEPGLGRTLAGVLASWQRSPEAATHRLEVLVCLNGRDGVRPRADLAAFARAASVPLHEVNVDQPWPPEPPPATGQLNLVALVTARAAKAIAWNVLRLRARGPIAVFLDADVSFTADAIGRVVEALLASPSAAIASARTVCAARPGAFEGIMAAPYGVVFPNLSPQLYAARLAALPAAMPEDLIDPERWLELMVGGAQIVRAPGVEVAVRLPGTLGDFFRQRIRIEMGKVQLARDYPGLSARSAPQPGVRAALAGLGAAGSVRLATYLALRSAAHAVAWWRYRRGQTAGIWRQAASTKRWDAA